MTAGQSLVCGIGAQRHARHQSPPAPRFAGVELERSAPRRVLRDLRRLAVGGATNHLQSVLAEVIDCGIAHGYGLKGKRSC